MKTRLYLGNLAYEITAADLTELFAAYGADNCYVATNAHGSRGFAFVDVDSDQADSAIANLDETTYQGRRLGVAPATPRPGSVLMADRRNQGRGQGS
jgi:RNA recognition motif-containing protein